MNREQILRLIAEDNGRLYRPDFHAWLSENFAIFVAFATQANSLWNRGRTHYSARTIIEWLRHETALRETSGGWKINDWYTPDMARLYMVLYPERTMFELRGQRKAA